MKQYAVIVAGGSGTRMGSSIPKQFLSLKGHPVLWWSLKAFHDENPDTEIILVLPADFIDLWKDFFTSQKSEEQFPHKIVAGGSSRTESVRNGLSAVENEDSLVAVHDGARPLVSGRMISQGWASAEASGAAIPVVAVTDSLRKIEGEGSVAVDRNEFVAVQTPQVFKTGILKDAYRKAGSKVFSDDASVVEAAGCKISLYDGDVVNMKITNPKDMAIASVIMDGNV